MKIDIAAISLDVRNFRHEKAKTEREAIDFLLSDEKHKILELAQDIVEQEGLDPSSLLIVAEDESSSAKYIALEGNRRITALKTLMTPELAAGTSMHAKFKSLHSAFLSLKISTVDCVVLDREKAAIWIKRKHYKGMGGAGVLPWNAVATARSDAAEGKFTRWMTSLAYLEKHGIDAEDIRDSIASKTTTIERVLASMHISQILGLIFDKSGILTPENGNEPAAAELVRALLEAMAERSFIEPTVSTSELQLNFIKGFAAMNVKAPAAPATSGAAGGGGGTASASGSASGGAGGGSTGGSGSSAASSTGAASATARSKPVKIRKMLASSGLRISNQPLNKFYSELRGLNVEKNPFLSATIIRTFLEKASTVFLESMNVPPVSTKPGAAWHDFEVKLRTKVESVLKSIDASSSNPKLSYARDVANGVRDKLHTIDHLNQAIHSHHALPSHSEIITIWDRFHPYFVELFDTIEKSKP